MCINFTAGILFFKTTGMIHRLFTENIAQKLRDDSKVIIIYGPRQVGKTTLARQVLADFEGRRLEVNGDSTDLAPVLSSRSEKKLGELVHGYDLLFIDEAQRIPDIGINLKILHDQFPGLKIITTGSSSFELANKVQEPLTGRTWTFNLMPIGLSELSGQFNRFELDQKLEDFLVFGAYPEAILRKNRAERVDYLQELARSYLFKDVLELGGIKYASKLRDLAKSLAFQIGSEVSLNELANSLQISKETVVNYIDLLEKTFVVFRLSSFSRNLRKEIVQKDKIFFYDLGIRNAIIENFQPLQSRHDGGQLWENFLLVERLKTQNYRREGANRYFWRTYTGAELDYVESHDGGLNGFEFKFSKKTARAPQAWLETYPGSTFRTINRENYLDFLL